MDRKFLVRSLKPGEEISFLDLYNFVHPAGMTDKYWRWLHLSAPAGPAIIESAWDGERLIGIYSLVPVRLWVKGEIAPGALSGVAVTHPDYRYRGIFTAMGKSLYRRARESGIKIIYGFPTEHSRHGLERALEWDYVNECRALVCWGSEGISGREDDALEIRRMQRAGREFNRLWPKLTGGAFRRSVLAVRDGDYYHWRFTRNPENRYIIYMALTKEGPAGCMVVRRPGGCDETCIDIADIIAGDIRVFRGLLTFTLRRCREAGCLRIRLSAGSVFYQCAKQMGFKESGYRHYFGCRTFNCPVAAADWYYTTGDPAEL